MNTAFMLIMIFLPIVFGAVLPAFGKKHKLRNGFVTAVLAIELALAIYFAVCGGFSMKLWSFTDQISIGFANDGPARFFSLLFAAVWLPVGIYGFVYMKHEGWETRFYSFYMMVEGALIGMACSSNLVSMYIFFEVVTLTSLPMVLHSLKKEAINASLKYLFYSIAGAFMALLGILFLSRYCTTLDFAPGGTLDFAAMAGKEKLLLAIIFIGVMGFGVKAGMYPLHGWLPTAHPVAPSPASAVLSGIITKSGVIGIFRIIYYIVGAQFLRGTWVQYTWLILAMLTIVMGSAMAYREKVFKKRLAYSTVSQVSYVLLGIFMLTGAGVVGSLLHVVFHAAAKVGLFLVAGTVIFATGRTKVEELRGAFKEVPLLGWCFTFVALALIGIPPLSGFVSKWYLATAALSSGLGVICWIAPVVLLVSALLTAGYLLPITVRGFFPGADYAPEKRAPRLKDVHGGAVLGVMHVVFAALSVALGVFSGSLVTVFSNIANTLF
ncbi:MAG: proton-conducting membrane transporter [Oscillospiraceae bacterium]|nr:proton-conducting membrane transporter [Oscillospiraceae bacterium]